MTKTITFNDLRNIKDRLPEGSMRKISEELQLNVETVRNYFGGVNFREGKTIGVHVEQGPNGGIVELDDTTILDCAYRILEEV